MTNRSTRPAAVHPDTRDREPDDRAGLDVRGVSVVVDDGRLTRAVLSDVTLHVDPGELVAVMGPSGSGKSTLIDVASGLVAPTAGSVQLSGALGPGEADWWADRRRDTIGVVHQRLNLLRGLSALDNVALALDLRGVGRRAARTEAVAALLRVDMAAAADTSAERLSVGEQQRVAIARAIVGGRPIVLADEPSAALDRTSADEITNLLADLADEGRAVLLVTHDAQQASWAHRTILLRDGVLVDHIDAHARPGATDPPLAEAPAVGPVDPVPSLPMSGSMPSTRLPAAGSVDGGRR